jgi:tryptophan-rich sensory protein
MSPASKAASRTAVAAIAAAVAAVAAVGGLATDTESQWYRSLELPPWQPPGAVFGPVWTVLYLLAGASAFLAWREVRGSRRRPVLALYAANGVLNAAWTVIFFRAHRPLLAWVEILLLLATIVALIVLVRPFSRPAAAALVPYALWVAFAATLNLSIAVDN